MQKVYTETNYEVTSNGEIYNVTTKQKLKPRINNGYNVINLTINGVRKGFTLHRLVAEAFIPKIEGKDYVNHKNGDKLDNRVENLEWVSQKENIQHALANNLVGTHPKKVDQYDLEKNYLRTFDMIEEAAKHIGLTRHSINLVLKGKNKTAGGFYWKYHKDNIDKTEIDEKLKKIDIMDNRYSVDEMGNVYSNIQKKYLKPVKNLKGYTYVTLSEKDKKKRNYYIHVLVATYLIPNNDEKKTIVNHKNGIKDDNRKKNLEWVTPSENNKHYHQCLKNK